MKFKNILRIAVFVVATAGFAQTPTIDVGDLQCLPNEENAPLTAIVSPELAGSTVRLYFRRLNPVEPFYYNVLFASGAGSHWTVFPKPENRDQEELDDEWWETLKDREWMEGHDRDWLEQWMEDQQHEAAEYFIAVHDASGERVARSDHILVEVWDPDDCDVQLSTHESGWSQNLTIGETVEDHQGKEVFHWLCDGIVTRINYLDIIRADEYCRGCVIALIPPWVRPVAGVVAGGLVLLSLQDDEGEVSPSRP